MKSDRQTRSGRSETRRSSRTLDSFANVRFSSFDRRSFWFHLGGDHSRRNGSSGRHLRLLLVYRMAGHLHRHEAVWHGSSLNGNMDSRRRLSERVSDVQHLLQMSSSHWKRRSNGRMMQSLSSCQFSGLNNIS